MAILQEARVKLANQVQQLQSAVAEGKAASQAAEQHAAGERARMAAAHAAAIADSRQVLSTSCYYLVAMLLAVAMCGKPDPSAARDVFVMSYLR